MCAEEKNSLIKSFSLCFCMIEDKREKFQLFPLAKRKEKNEEKNWKKKILYNKIYEIYFQLEIERVEGGRGKSKKRN